MTTPSTCVFDLTPPRRPGIDDVGGGAKQDDIFFPPDPVEMPTGADDNQHQNLHVRACGIVPAATVTVHFSGSTPSVFLVQALSLAVVSGTFTVTDLGVGITKLSWAANKFPARIADHRAWATGGAIASATAETGTNFVTVRTGNAAGAAADIPFVVDIMGD